MSNNFYIDDLKESPFFNGIVRDRKMSLWESEEKKLNKSGRKWSPSPTYLPYRCAELYCEKCGKSLGIFDIVTTNLEGNMYCSDCVSTYINPVPNVLPCGTIVDDIGNYVTIEYTDNYYKNLQMDKLCYFNKKGRYIKVKGKRYYI